MTPSWWEASIQSRNIVESVTTAASVCSKMRPLFVAWWAAFRVAYLENATLALLRSRTVSARPAWSLLAVQLMPNVIREPPSRCPVARAANNCVPAMEIASGGTGVRAFRKGYVLLGKKTLKRKAVAAAVLNHGTGSATLIAPGTPGLTGLNAMKGACVRKE